MNVRGCRLRGQLDTEERRRSSTSRLAALIGAAIAIAIAALAASPPKRADRELGEMLARRIACTPRYPVPCGRNPLALAYGFPLGKLVRQPRAHPGRPADGELPVDFRRCRSSSCALPGPDAGSDRLAAPGDGVHLGRGPAARRRRGPRHLLALPAGRGWERIVRERRRRRDRRGGRELRLNLEDDPALVPLETLARPQPLPVPAGRGTSLALVDRLTTERSPPSVRAAMHDRRFRHAKQHFRRDTSPG